MKKNKTIIIAEIGVNHNGNINQAKKLINIAKKSGADYVKFQTFKTENLVCKNTKTTRYQSNNLGKKTNQFNLLKKLELSENDHKKDWPLRPTKTRVIKHLEREMHRSSKKRPIRSVAKYMKKRKSGTTGPKGWKNH